MFDAVAQSGAPYIVGENDCFRMACRVVHALVGVDRWPEFHGRYSNYAESIRLLAEHGRTFQEAFDWFFGAPHAGWAMARRGDVVAFQTPDKEKHLGVCMGSTFALITVDEGLKFPPMRTALCSWKVGQ